MFGHLHAGAGSHQRRGGGDVECAGPVTARAAGVEDHIGAHLDLLRQLGHGARQADDLLRGLAFHAQGAEESAVCASATRPPMISSSTLRVSPAVRSLRAASAREGRSHNVVRHVMHLRVLRRVGGRHGRSSAHRQEVAQQSRDQLVSTLSGWNCTPTTGSWR